MKSLSQAVASKGWATRPISISIAAQGVSLPRPISLTALILQYLGLSNIDGYADIHSHLMTDLAIGGAVFWGKPDGPIQEALAWCKPKHGEGGTFIGNTMAPVEGGK